MMTVMIPEFFGLPHSLVRTGKLRELNGTAVSLLVAMWHESERTCTRELTRTDSQLARLIKGHRNSIAAARKELLDAGLVTAEPFGAKGFVYQLCDPNTGKPWPGPPDKQVKYVKKVSAPRSELGGAQSRPNRKKITNSDLAGVNFPYGHNAPDAHDSEPPPEASTSSSEPRWDEIGRR